MSICTTMQNDSVYYILWKTWMVACFTCKKFQMHLNVDFENSWRLQFKFNLASYLITKTEARTKKAYFPTHSNSKLCCMSLRSQKCHVLWQKHEHVNWCRFLTGPSSDDNTVPFGAQIYRVHGTIVLPPHQRLGVNYVKQHALAGKP